MLSLGIAVVVQKLTIVDLISALSCCAKLYNSISNSTIVHKSQCQYNEIR